MAQAERDLEQAQASRRDGRHGWACFAAQQAAEIALKALYNALRQEAWGRVVAELPAALPEPAPQSLVDKGKVLDNFYVATRYANGHTDGPPFEHYGPIQSGQAIAYAREIIEYSRLHMAGSRDG